MHAAYRVSSTTQKSVFGHNTDSVSPYRLRCPLINSLDTGIIHDNGNMHLILTKTQGSVESSLSLPPIFFYALKTHFRMLQLMYKWL